MAKGFLGYDGKAHYIDKVYVGVNNKARLCKTGYVGVNGIARRIMPFPISVPKIEGTYYYTGETQTAQISDYDDSVISVSGDLSGKNAGTYTIVFSIIDQRYMWKDGTRTPKSVSWIINKQVATPPIITSGTLYYRGGGNAQSPTWEYDPYIWILDNSSEYNGWIAKEYNCRFYIYPSKQNNYEAPGHKTDIIIPWRIEPTELRMNIISDFPQSGGVCKFKYSQTYRCTFEILNQNDEVINSTYPGEQSEITMSWSSGSPIAQSATLAYGFNSVYVSNLSASDVGKTGWLKYNSVKTRNTEGYFEKVWNFEIIS